MRPFTLDKPFWFAMMIVDGNIAYTLWAKVACYRKDSLQKGPFCFRLELDPGP